MSQIDRTADQTLFAEGQLEGYLLALRMIEEGHDRADLEEFAVTLVHWVREYRAGHRVSRPSPRKPRRQRH
jgi:hypothetical protein